MDRGRVGYAASGNKFIRELIIKSRRHAHTQRIKKIMTRKPGTSNTLDNRPPHIIKALLTNPRKVALRQEFNVVTERENKALLKRIGKILTAPPTITDEEYQKMRKLCPSFKGPKEVYEEQLEIKRHEKFVKHLKKIAPVYDIKSWERDYRKQLFHQRFIRQVAYKRSEDFIDPLPNVEGNINTSLNTSLSHTDSMFHVASPSRQKLEPLQQKASVPRSTSSHVNRIRGMKNTISDIQKARQSTHRGEFNIIDLGAQESKFDSVEDEYEVNSIQSDGPGESRVEVTCRQTKIKLFCPNKDDLNNTLKAKTESDLSCWLINNKSLVIVVTSNIPDVVYPHLSESLRELEFIQAEAEISLIDLASLNPELDVYIDDINESLDMEKLKNVAQKLLDTVSISIEDGEARLLVQLDVQDGQPSTPNPNPNEISAIQPSSSSDMDPIPNIAVGDEYEMEFEEGLTSTLSPSDLRATIDATEDQFAQNIVEENKMQITKDVKITLNIVELDEEPPVKSLKRGLSSSNSLIPKQRRDLPVAPKKKRYIRSEQLSASVTVSTSHDEEVEISARFTCESQARRHNRASLPNPAIKEDAVLVTTTGLPSIAQADMDLLTEYLNNLATSVLVEHDIKTGSNRLWVDL